MKTNTKDRLALVGASFFLFGYALAVVFGLKILGLSAYGGPAFWIVLGITFIADDLREIRGIPFPKRLPSGQRITALHVLRLAAALTFLALVFIGTAGTLSLFRVDAEAAINLSIYSFLGVFALRHVLKWIRRKKGHSNKPWKN